ncbi:MAG: HepT-like ribonuclease domain-containing protein [bacterium]
MIFSESEKGSVFSRLSFLESEIKDLDEYRNISWETYRQEKTARKTVERTIENIVNALIDISKIILSDKSAGDIPQTYGAVILKLAELKIIDFPLAEKLAEYVKLRNFLSHQYLDLRWDKIKGFLSGAPEHFQHFIQQINNSIQ